jgi:flagellar basal body-associated protein FliL
MAEDNNAAGLGDMPASGGGARTRGMLLLVMALGVAGIAATGGFMVQRMMAGQPSTQPGKDLVDESHAEQAVANPLPNEELVYFDFDPVVVNLNEKRMARYVRATITLAIRKSDKSAKESIEARMPELKSWLTVYLAGCTLEDLCGSKNLNRLLRHIEESFNSQLWPNKRGLISHVLFKEIAVQ